MPQTATASTHHIAGQTRPDTGPAMAVTSPLDGCELGSVHTAAAVRIDETVQGASGAYLVDPVALTMRTTRKVIWSPTDEIADRTEAPVVGTMTFDTWRGISLAAAATRHHDVRSDTFPECEWVKAIDRALDGGVGCAALGASQCRPTASSR